MLCASAFLTSDWEIPNCLAIADGLTPALKAARTAFSLPVVNEPAPSSAASWRRCGFALATGFSFAGLGGRRPRRSASVVTAASSASISTSSNRFSAPAKSFGKKWRCGEARLSGPVLPFGTAEGSAAVTVGGAENRSGVVSAGRRVGMPNYAAGGSPRQRLNLAVWDTLSGQINSPLVPSGRDRFAVRRLWKSRTARYGSPSSPPILFPLRSRLPFMRLRRNSMPCLICPH